MSVWNANERRVSRERDAQRHAVGLLAGVGGDHEWWIYSPGLVGQLRVPVTEQEYKAVPPGCVIADAGETGPQRPRIYAEEHDNR